MRRILAFILCIAVCLSAAARKYKYSFRNTPLADALVQISREHPDIRLSFIYDELDSYHVTASVDTDNPLEAVRTVTGSVPAIVTGSRKGIYVEALQHGLFRYTGRAVGEDAAGVPYATVMVLSPKDSTVLTYAFTDNDGRFSIPCDSKGVILKISSVGYHTKRTGTKGFYVGNIIMKQLPVALKGVTVKTDVARIEQDKTVFVPGKRQKNSAHGGADLLRAMAIPTVRVNPMNGEISTMAGDGIATFIDFLPADANEVSGIRPQDVKRVEVYDNPQDPRFGGARHVVNFIMVKYEYGGYTKVMADQRFSTGTGNYGMNSKFTYGKMTYDVAAGYNWSQNNHSRSETTSNYKFSSEDLTWSRKTDESRASSNSEYATLRAVYSTENLLISNTVGYQGSGGHSRQSELNSYTPQIYTDGVSRSASGERSNSANWRGSYQITLPRSMSLSITPNLRYAHHSNDYLYSFDDDGILNFAREDAWSSSLSAFGQKKWGQHSLNIGLTGEFHDTRINYDGSDVARVHSWYGSAGVATSCYLQFGGFWFMPDVRLYYTHNVYDDIKYDDLRPVYFIQLGYNFNQRNKLEMSAEMSNWTVGVAQRSPNIVRLNLLDAITGNPSMKTFLHNSVNANYQWSARQNLFVSFFGRYTHLTRPVVNIYTPAEIDGREMMLRSLTRDGYDAKLNYGASASLNLFDGSLNLWGALQGNHVWIGGDRSFSGNWLQANIQASYYLGNFYFSAYYGSPSRRTWVVNQVDSSPGWYELSVGWSAKGFNISVTGSNIFNGTTARSRHMESYYDNYSRVSDTYSRDYGHSLLIQMSYSIPYGKKIRQDNGPGSTGTISSGILKQSGIETANLYIGFSPECGKECFYAPDICDVVKNHYLCGVIFIYEDYTTKIMDKDIAVSIVVHKTDSDELRRAVGCVLVCPRVAMVHVIDNSPDNSLQTEFGADAEKPYMGRLSYRHVENRGFGAGHNIAIKESSGTGILYHLVMNADVEWQGDVIGTLATYMDSHGDIGLIAPKIFYPDGDLQLTARRLPTPWDVFAKRFLPYNLIRKRMERYLLCGADHDRIIDSPYLLGSFMFFRVSALEECGSFDERFFMYPEDIDISRRIHAFSRTVYYPFVNIIHRHAAESRRSFKMLCIHAFNMIKYFNKWGWWIDRSRRLYNRRLEASITPVDYSERPHQRG